MRRIAQLALLVALTTTGVPSGGAISRAAVLEAGVALGGAVLYTCRVNGVDQTVTQGDTVNGTPQDDVINCKDAGVDLTIDGKDGGDRIIGGYETDVVLGGPGFDEIRAGIGPDTVFAHEGNDQIYGDESGDTLDGGLGADNFFGGTGRADIVTYGGRTDRVVADPGGGEDDGVSGEGDNIAPDVEALIGGNAGDTLRGSGVRNWLQGRGGNDTLLGFGMGDTLIGGEGFDTTKGASGNDTCKAERKEGCEVKPLPRGPANITVRENRFLKNGNRFVPRGFNMIGLLSPGWCWRGRGETAQESFGPMGLLAARTWGANTLRLQVSQRGLSGVNPPDFWKPDMLTSYINRIVEDVNIARSYGFVVIVSMQDQWVSCGEGHPLPSWATVKAWRNLAPHLAGDRGVMFEIFNEPQNEPTNAGWRQWKAGGREPMANKGDRAWGHQDLVRELRNLGVTSVVIADGAKYAGTLEGVPFLRDPRSDIAYGVHPFYYTDGKSGWNRRFGNLATRRAVLNSEWNFKAKDCGHEKEDVAPRFLSYHKRRHIGVMAHAFDKIDSVIRDLWRRPTACGTSHPGPGKVVQKYLLSQA